MASRRQQSGRQHLAYLAARLIAEDGVADYASARRKVARQQGVRNERDLPDDRAIAAALRSFQALYQADTHPDDLRALREVAVRAMTLLAEFDPWLVGPVLTGEIGAHAQVQLHVYTDRAKDLQLFLLGRDIACQFGERRYSHGGRQVAVPVLELLLDDSGEAVQVTLFGSSDLREGARARLPQVKRLLDEAAQAATTAVADAAGAPAPAAAGCDGAPDVPDGFALQIRPRQRSWD